VSLPAWLALPKRRTQPGLFDEDCDGRFAGNEIWKMVGVRNAVDIEKNGDAMIH